MAKKWLQTRKLLFAEVNSTLYFSKDILESMTEQEVKEDKEEKILAVCEPFNTKFGYDIEKGSPKAFKIQSKLYSEGLRLNAYYSETRSAEFNLEGKYSELSFSVGHIDETGLQNKFYLRIYLDDFKNPYKEFDSYVVGDLINYQNTDLLACL